MRIAAVICEFNPFHNGHKYLLDEIRRQGYGCIICVMSGSFTQRGEPAIFDKFARAGTALKNGADLVIELPTPFAVASAERFAKVGVQTVAALKAVDTVFFGSEAGDIELIKKAAAAVDSTEVCQKLRHRLAQGEYYPNALQKSVGEVYGAEISDVLAMPNNILGVEYMRELKKADIEARTVLRVGVAHDSSAVVDGIASASNIRERILKGLPVNGLMPKEELSNPASLLTGERAVLFKLKELSVEEIARLADVNEGLENRIYSAARSCSSLEELLFGVKTKRYTMARLRRITASAILGITKDLQACPVSYIRVLGMTKAGGDALSKIAAKTDLPIITGVASGLKALDDKAKKTLMCDINATDLRTVFEATVSSSGKDFTHGLIKIL